MDELGDLGFLSCELLQSWFKQSVMKRLPHFYSAAHKSAFNGLLRANVLGGGRFIRISCRVEFY